MASTRKRKRVQVKASPDAPTGAVKASGDPPKSVTVDASKVAHGAVNDFLGGSPRSRVQDRPGRKKSATSDPWGEVIETVFDLDPVELTDRLTDELKLGLFVGDYGRLRDALDHAATNLYDAKRLERASKLEEARYEDENLHRMELLRTAARETLQAERVKGAGVITKQQIEDRMIATWHDEVSDFRKRTRQLHNTARVLEGLTEAWNHRNSQLKVILERASLGRPRGGGQ